MKRSTNERSKLNLKKETLRQLQLLTLSENQLRQVAGGVSATCGDEGRSVVGQGC